MKGALFEISGGADQWATFDQTTWINGSLNCGHTSMKLKPYLWRQGETYPKDENELHSLFANKEVDFSITQAIVGAGALIEQD